MLEESYSYFLALTSISFTAASAAGALPTLMTFSLADDSVSPAATLTTEWESRKTGPNAIVSHKSSRSHCVFESILLSKCLADFPQSTSHYLYDS